MMGLEIHFKCLYLLLAFRSKQSMLNTCSQNCKHSWRPLTIVFALKSWSIFSGSRVGSLHSQVLKYQINYKNINSDNFRTEKIKEHYPKKLHWQKHKEINTSFY